MAEDAAVQASWLDWAVKALSETQSQYERYESYYIGEHELEFATDRWEAAFGTVFEEFADNWCQVVIDAVVQKMEITGWQQDGEKQGTGDAKVAEEIWDRNELGVEEDDVHTQTQVKGDAYLMVWPDPDNNDESEVYFNDALYTTVFYDPNRRRRIARGAKRWIDLDGKTHMYIYTPDAIYKYLSGTETDPTDVALMQLRGETLDAGSLPAGWRLETEPEENPYDLVPIFHFRNKAAAGTHGLSELASVIPMQNAVNKLVMDLLVGSEFGSFRQKHIAGGGVPKNADGTTGWRAGGDRVWHTTDPQARFGEFGQIDLEPIFRAIDSLVGHIAKISQTPMHYLRTSGDMPSGEALKTAESGLVGKIKSRQKQYGAAWSKAMTFAVQLESGSELDNPVYPVWKDAETRHDLEQAQTAQLKSILGVPLTQLWAEHFDYTQEQVAEFEKANKALAAAVLAQVVAQVGQLPPGSEQVTADPQALIELVKGANLGPMKPTADGESGLDISQVLALLGKGVTAQTTAGEATTKPQPNTTPPASPTRRSRGFKD